MRAITIALLLIAFFAGLAWSEPVANIKELYSAPSENSNLVYKIPIDVKILEVSPDGNWHKVRIAYSFGPLSYSYVGWAKVPVGDILAARLETEELAIIDEAPPEKIASK
ncbi:MAG: hypothetical protein ABIH50_05760 [bacterium]